MDFSVLSRKVSGNAKVAMLKWWSLIKYQKCLSCGFPVITSKASSFELVWMDSVAICVCEQKNSSQKRAQWGEES